VNTPTAEVQATADALVDRAQRLEAQALGHRMEAAKLLGLHDVARQYMNEMYTLIRARRAAVFGKAEQGECFFNAAGAAEQPRA
jgi:hypothetical protein